MNKMLNVTTSVFDDSVGIGSSSRQSGAPWYNYETTTSN